MAISLPGPDQKARLVSYFTTDPASEKYVLGCEPYYSSQRLEGYGLVLRQLSKANNDYTTFYFAGESDGSGFRLKWGQDQSLFLTFINVRNQLYLNSDPLYRAAHYSIFTIDAVKNDDTWFALNNFNKQWVVDVKGATTADKTPCISWQWNGGDNQVWRAETV
jgi:hypothetical protein